MRHANATQKGYCECRAGQIRRGLSPQVGRRPEQPLRSRAERGTACRRAVGAAGEIRSRARRGREKASTAQATRRSPRLSPSLVSFPWAAPRVHCSPHSSWGTLRYRQASFTRADFIRVYFHSSGKWEPGRSVPNHAVSAVEGCWILPSWHGCTWDAPGSLDQDLWASRAGRAFAQLFGSSIWTGGWDAVGSLMPWGRLSSCPMG